MSQIAVLLINLFAGLWKRPPVLAVLVINLIPAFCVLFFGWDALALLLLYWAENVVLGVINIGRMAVAAFREGVGGVLTALFLIPFFIIHYGGFCLGHLVFILLVAGGTFTGGDPLEALKTIWALRWDYAVPLVAMTAFHLTAFIEWIRSGGWKAASLQSTMGEPYGRIIVMHLTVIGGAIAVVALGQPAAAVALLAVLKTIMEALSTHRRMKKEEAAAAAATAPGRPFP